MHSVLVRTLGYWIPTAVVVTWLHVARDASPGEWIDGVVSSLMFALFFWVGAVFGRRPHAPSPATGGSVLRGLVAGLVAWGALWLFWSVPVTAPLRASTTGALLVNGIVMAAAGWLSAPGSKLRPLEHAAR